MTTDSLQYLERARKILNDEYARAHTAEYTTWLNNHKNAWMQPHVVVPFPPFVVNSTLAPFKPTVTCPTESDIVARALELYNQANPQPVQPVVTVAGPAQTVSEPAVIDIEPVPVEPEPVVNAEPVVTTELATAQEPVVEETKPISGKLLSMPIDVLPDEKIRDIFKPIDDTMFKDNTIESVKKDLNAVPQPNEELSKIDKLGPSTFFQKLKDKWSTR